MLIHGSCCDIVATPWIGVVQGPAVLHRIYEREKHFQWAINTDLVSGGSGQGGKIPALGNTF